MDNQEEFEFCFPEMTMGDFFRRLANPSFPNPTGGGAIAVTALAGVNLLLMVLYHNTRRQQSEPLVQKAVVYSRHLEVINQRLWQLMVEDIRVLEDLLEAGKSEKIKTPNGDEFGHSACITLLAILENIVFCLNLIPDAQGLNRIEALKSDLEAANLLLIGAARATGVLLNSNLAGFEDLETKQKLEQSYFKTFQDISKAAHNLGGELLH